MADRNGSASGPSGRGGDPFERQIPHNVEAERAAFKGDYTQARSLYRDALYDLGRDNIHSPGRLQAAQRINAEIDRLRALENKE